MTIEPIAYYYSVFPTKFGIPRQSGIVGELRGYIVFTPRFRSCDAVRGMDGFDYLWLLWEFSANKNDRQNATWSHMVRPPLLGGNKAVGVFASRSPFRPNAIGLSSVKLDRIEYVDGKGPVIHVLGADLMNETPIYDIKPYVTYSDSHPEARSGFVDTNRWQQLTVHIADELKSVLPNALGDVLIKVLECDPRPQYHDDAHKIYGMPFDMYDVHFKVEGNDLYVVDIKELK